MLTIGVIGVGVVGGAVLKAFGECEFKVIGFDPYKEEYKDFEPILNAHVLFVCVPTPTKGMLQDQTALIDTLTKLSDADYKGVVCVKCTVLPGTMSGMQKRFPKLKLAHNPEFLTAARPYEDFLNQPAILISGPITNILAVSDIYRAFNPSIQQYAYLDFESTEIAKYAHNCFLAVKVGYLNDIHDICEKMHISYTEMMRGAVAMGGIGFGHTKIAPDGQKGWGGMCFPKDTKALLRFAQTGLLLPFETLDGAVNANFRRRAGEME